VSEPDPLGTRFAAFRQACITTTQRPGVLAVRRTVARRRANRALVAGALTMLAGGAAVWLSHRASTPNPAASPSSSPTTAVATSPTTPTASPAPAQQSLMGSGAPVGGPNACNLVGAEVCPERKEGLM